MESETVEDDDDPGMALLYSDEEVIHNCMAGKAMQNLTVWPGITRLQQGMYVQ